MKKKVIILTLSGALVIGAAAVAVAFSNKVLNSTYLKANPTEYVLTIDSPLYEGNDPEGSGVGNKVVQTALGNDVKFEYNKLYEYETGYSHVYDEGVNCMKNGSYFAIVANSEGNGVAGISSIEITTDNDSYGDPKLIAYFGWSDGEYLANEVKSTGDGDCTYIYTFNDQHPTFVKFASTASDDRNRVGIHEIVITYECVTYSNPYSIDGDYGYYVYGDHATVALYKGTDVDLVIPSVAFGQPVTSIADNFLFTNMPVEDVETVTLPSSITSIGGSAFKGASKLESINLDDVTYIGSFAFYYAVKLSAVDLSSAEYINEYAFTHCDLLNDIGSFASIVEIGTSAFQSTGSLNIALSFPASLTHLYGSCFMYSAITSLTIHDDAVCRIDDAAFRTCDNLASVYLGDHVYETDDFNYCDSLSTITVGANNEEYCAIDNVLYYMSSANYWYGIRLAQNRAQTSYVMPAQVKQLFPYFAYNASTLESLTFNDYVTSTADYSFDYCENLNSVTFGSSLTLIENSFSGCIGLTSLHIPGTVKHVSQKAFVNCEGLETVIMDDGIERLDKEAFQGCTALTTAVIPSTLTSAGDKYGWTEATTDVFEGCTALTNVFTRLTSGSYATSVDGPIYTGFYGSRTLNLYSESSATGCWHFDGSGTPVLW